MANWLIQDEKIRKLFIQQYKTAQVVRVEIERTEKNIDIFVYAGQPGPIIGKDGGNIPVVTKAINKIVGRKIKVNINVLKYDNVG
jgi:small subunit ribosomal protein S3